LEYLSKVVLSEFGLMWCDGQGRVNFQGRNAMGTRTAAEYDDRAYSELEYDYSFDRVVNSVSLNNGVSTVSANDSVSVSKDGERFQKYDVLLSSATEMQSLATGLSKRLGSPAFAPKQTKHRFYHQYYLLPDDDVGRPVVVNFTPPGATGFEYLRSPQLLITAVSHSVSPENWAVTVNYDVAISYWSLILDDRWLGLLDKGELGL
jgi:hypothetical protein